MKSLMEVNETIYKTDCDECVLDGWFCSQPILTKDDNGILIDNYFSYGCYNSFKEISTPLVVFGIYADEEKTAYKNWIPQSERKEITLEEDTINVEDANRAYDRFEELYPTVRECAYSECNDEQKEAVKEYVSCLEVFSGPVVWKFYQDLFPSFFDWAKSL